MCSRGRPPRRGDNKERKKKQHTREGNTSGQKTWECPNCRTQNVHHVCHSCGKKTKGSTSVGRRQIGNNAHHMLYQRLQEERADRKEERSMVCRLIKNMEHAANNRHKQESGGEAGHRSDKGQGDRTEAAAQCDPRGVDGPYGEELEKSKK